MGVAFSSLLRHGRPDRPGAGRRARIRVVVVSNVRFYRDGLAGALARGHGFEVVGVASQLDGLAELQLLAPEVLLVDAPMPESRDAVRRAAEALTNTKLVALAASEDDAEVVAWAEAGASSYCTSDAGLDELASTVERAAGGEVVWSPSVAAALLRRIAETAAPAASGVPLTTREREIVTLLEQGLSNKEIASHLFITVATVKNHVHRILEKLGVERRSDVPSAASRSGLNPL